MNIIEIIQMYNPFRFLFRFIALRYLYRQFLNAKKAKGTEIESYSEPNSVSAHATVQQLYFAYLLVKFVDVTNSGGIIRQSKFTSQNGKLVVEDAVEYYLKKKYDKDKL